MVAQTKHFLRLKRDKMRFGGIVRRTFQYVCSASWPAGKVCYPSKRNRSTQTCEWGVKLDVDSILKLRKDLKIIFSRCQCTNVDSFYSHDTFDFTNLNSSTSLSTYEAADDIDHRSSSLRLSVRALERGFRLSGVQLLEGDSISFYPWQNGDLISVFGDHAPKITDFTW